MRVLVVDDTAKVRERLVALIAAIDGIEQVSQAADGIDGLACIQLDRPEVVVMDLRMPRMNGFRMLASLEHEAHRPTAIVVSTQADFRATALRAGARFFFEKGTELDALVGTIAELASAPGNQLR